MENKIKEAFKIQLINLCDDLLVVFNNDNFIYQIKSYIKTQLLEPDFFDRLHSYFCKDIEEAINNKNDDILFKTNFTFIPNSKEDLIKLKMGRYWKNLSNKNKEKVWEYFLILLKLYKTMV